MCFKDNSWTIDGDSLKPVDMYYHSSNGFCFKCGQNISSIEHKLHLICPITTNQLLKSLYRELCEFLFKITTVTRLSYRFTIFNTVITVGKKWRF